MSALPSWLNWLKGPLIGFIDPLIRNRVLHVPDGELSQDAAAAGVTADQWRAVEAQQASRVETILATL